MLPNFIYGSYTGLAVTVFGLVPTITAMFGKSILPSLPKAVPKTRKLLVPIFKGGKKVYEEPSLKEIRDYCLRQTDTLWDEVKRFENPHKYYVDLSKNLWAERNGLIEKFKGIK